jgi:malonyl CoA-acyl carrier protein transacylase
VTEVLLFPGQGSQHAGMGELLFDRYPELVAQASDILGWSIRRICTENPGAVLDDTRFTQPAVHVVNALQFRALREAAGPDAAWPHLVLGHSLGEYSALEAAGVIGFADSVQLVAERARLTANVRGAMTAVLGLDLPRIQAVLHAAGLNGIDLANLNTPRQTVLAGPAADICRAETALAGAGAFDIRRLAVSGPFHSRYMSGAAEQFARVLARVTFAEPAFPVIANRTGVPYAAGQYGRLLAEHICHPVRWHESIDWILRHYDHVSFTEAGDRGFLLRMLRQISPGHAPPPRPQPATPRMPAATARRPSPRSPADRDQSRSDHGHTSIPRAPVG